MTIVLYEFDLDIGMVVLALSNIHWTRTQCTSILLLLWPWPSDFCAHTWPRSIYLQDMSAHTKWMDVHGWLFHVCLTGYISPDWIWRNLQYAGTNAYSLIWNQHRVFTWNVWLGLDLKKLSVWNWSKSPLWSYPRSFNFRSMDQIVRKIDNKCFIYNCAFWEYCLLPCNTSNHPRC